MAVEESKNRYERSPERFLLLNSRKSRSSSSFLEPIEPSGKHSEERRGILACFLRKKRPEKKKLSLQLGGKLSPLANSLSLQLKLKAANRCPTFLAPFERRRKTQKDKKRLRKTKREKERRRQTKEDEERQSQRKQD